MEQSEQKESQQGLMGAPIIVGVGVIAALTYLYFNFNKIKPQKVKQEESSDNPPPPQKNGLINLDD